MKSWTLIALMVISTLALAAERSQAADIPWVVSWGCGPQLTEPNNMPPPPGVVDSTVRQVVRLTLGGSRLRVRFSNAFGTQPLNITSVHIAIPNGPGSIDPATDKALTFNGGSPSVVIQTGAPILSDPVDFPVKPLSDLAITLHVADPSTRVTGHPGARCTTYIAAGDEVSAATLPTPATCEHWYYIQGVDVVGTNKTSVVATLGDSITDGRGSTTNGNDRWPDNLAKRLQADKHTSQVGVLNVGIGGNCVIRGGLGPTALTRLDRDVLVQPGVRWCILFECINDLGGRASADDIIHAYQQIIDRTHACGIEIYGATITPCGGSFYASPELEANRTKINAWIREPGHFDGVIDFDAAVRDPQNPTHVLAAADSGDHLHLSPAGYRMLADAIDLKLFR